MSIDGFSRQPTHLPEPIQTKKSEQSEASKIEKLAQFVIEIPEDSIFYDTDLIVVSDMAKELGPLPVNVILESGFKLMESLYQKINNGEESAVIQIVDKTTQIKGKDSSFKAQTMKSIKQMMTRPIGRALLWTLTQSKPVFHSIEISAGSESHVEPNEPFADGRKKVKVKLSDDTDDDTHTHQHLPTGIDAIRENDPEFITLAHELFHCLNDCFSPEGQKRLETAAPEGFILFHNMEEFIAITGWKIHPKVFFEKIAEMTKLEEEPTEPSLELQTDFESIYTKLNERDFTAEFTSSELPLFPRSDHRASKPIKKTEADLVQVQRTIENYQRRRKLIMINGLWDVASEKIKSLQDDIRIIKGEDERVNDLKAAIDALNFFKMDNLDPTIKNEMEEQLDFLQTILKAETEILIKQYGLKKKEV